MMSVPTPPVLDPLAPDEACRLWQYVAEEQLVNHCAPDATFIRSKLDSSGVYSVGSKRDPLSNFWVSPFEAREGMFHTREHYIVYRKLELTALDISVGEIYRRLQEIESPGEAKRFGRTHSSPASITIWHDEREAIVRETLYRAVFQDRTSCGFS